MRESKWQGLSGAEHGPEDCAGGYSLPFSVQVLNYGRPNLAMWVRSESMWELERGLMTGIACIQVQSSVAAMSCEILVLFRCTGSSQKIY
jgi:hypothetical protein